jgi:hypothetical protein
MPEFGSKMHGRACILRLKSRASTGEWLVGTRGSHSSFVPVIIGLLSMNEMFPYPQFPFVY